jgi:hypothetical protein
VAGALTVVRLAVVGDNPPPDPLPTQVVGPPPDRISVNGRDLVRTGDDVEMGIARIDRDDPATLVVPAGMHAPDADPHCVPHTVVRILSQNARAVEIRAFAYEPADPPAGPVICPGVRYPDLLHRLTLAAPLGDREVRSGTTTVPVVDAGTILWPSYLPAGFARPPNVTLVFPRPDRRAGSSQLSYFAGSDRYLFIRQADPPAEAASVTAGGQPSVFLPESSLEVTARPTVRGRPGVVFDYSPAQRCLRWRETADLAIVICLSPAATPGADDLLAVAESLRARR